MSKSTPVYAWHFLPEDRRLSNGDNRLVVPGKRHTVRGDIVLCEHGLHASERPIDTLKYAKSAMIQRVKMHGTVVHGNDKLVASSRTCMWIADAAMVLHEFACLCAEDALALIPNPDPRSVNAIAVKRAWLRGQATDDELAAARDAAWDAARDAARAAAWDAAWDAARAAQNSRLHMMLMALAPEGYSE